MNSACPLIGFGQVRHTRLRPKLHAFAYPTYFLMLPMRQIDEHTSPLAINRWAGISFYDQDHGDGRGSERGGALGWLEETLRQNDIEDAKGEIWLHTYPRVLGYTFKPVSFWYCHHADGSLRAIVVEVNNTFKERHCYLIDRPQYGHELTVSKVFHVSPFCQSTGQYRFRFMRTEHLGQERTVVRVEHDDHDGLLIQTSVSGRLQAITPSLLRQTLWRYPAMTLMVMARIHWQALQLLLKRIGLQHKPARPDQFLTR